jgi:Ca2+-transporting ATPase
LEFEEREMTVWYQKSFDEILQQLNSNPHSGLTDAQAEQLRHEFGYNELVERGVKNPWIILLDQFKETMVIILIIAAIISALLGDFKDALAILAIIIINAILGFRQEYQAERAMAALKKMAVPTVRVRRDGHVKEISARLLVPGDIILLEAGNSVPADCRIFESVNLRVQEAALTGESEPVSKISDAIPQKDISLADRHNMVFMGTAVTFGRGQAIVTETGMRTELGGIAELIQSAGLEDTPLQRRLDQLGKSLALAALALVVIVFLLGILHGEELKILFLTSISIAVAAVPEGLPAVVTIALALGARRMLRRKALIRKLPAVEALGSVTVICSDKTGTLTENRMTVTVLDLAEHRLELEEEETRLHMHAKDEPCIHASPTPEQAETLRKFQSLSLLLAGGGLCNDAILDCEDDRQTSFHIVGDPTEGALVVAAARMGLDKDVLEQTFPRVAEAPFDSERKRMTTIHKIPPSKEQVPPELEKVWDWAGLVNSLNYVAFTKGAVDGLMQVSTQVWVEDHIESINDDWRQRIEAGNFNLAQNGMRVLGIAYRSLEKIPESVTPEDLEQDLIFVGMTGMIDPARQEVKAAVETCREAGIRPIMITGDHPLTAGYIAKELGFDYENCVVSGQELERMSDTELQDSVANTHVFARVSPEHKLRIVNALQTRGEIVAMTGDGVNDAPALKKADIGVAMGITGTDVSKEAADMVLLDDNFATIVAAVEEGRTIYDNIRKFIQYTLSSNMGEIIVMLLAPFLNMPLPLLPLQILWINLVTDGLPGLALGVENAERNTMRRTPYPPNENTFARGLGASILWVGVLMGFVSLGCGFFYWKAENPIWRTMIFTTLTLSEMGYVMGIRSFRDSLFRIGVFSNRALIGAVGLTTLLQIAVIYLPFFQNLLGTVALPLKDLAICLILSTTLFWAVEIQKALYRRSG